MKHVRGAPFHPQTQGNTERRHQTTKNRILNARTVNRIGYSAMRLTCQPHYFGFCADWLGGIETLRRARDFCVIHIDTPAHTDFMKPKN